MKNGALCHFQRNRIWDIKKVKHDLMLSAVIALVLEASIKFFIFMKLLTAYFTIRRWIRAIFWLQVREQLERYKKSMFLGELSRSKLSIQFSSVAQSCPTFCDLMGGSTPGLPVRHQLSEFTQTHVHRVSDAIQTISSSAVPFSSCLQSFPAWGSFPMSQFFASGGQSIGASASASVLPMNI